MTTEQQLDELRARLRRARSNGHTAMARGVIWVQEQGEPAPASRVQIAEPELIEVA
jgi:hypothetical protein